MLPAPGSGGRQAAFVVVGDAITVLALLVTSMILARVIVPGDMATFRQVTYLGPFATGLAEFGISGTVYRYYRVYKGDTLQSFLWQVLASLLALGTLGSLILLALAYPLAKSFGNPGLAPALVITCAFVLTSLPFMMVRPVLINQGYSLKATLWEAAMAVGAAVALILPLKHGCSLNEGLVFWMIANAARLLVVLWYIGLPLLRARPSWDSVIISELWSYLWPLQLSRLPGIIMSYFDKVVTSLFLSKPAFAAYSLGAREIPFVNTMPYSVSSVMLPRMVEALEAGQVDRICALWRKACISTALITYPIAAFCIWYAKPIIRAVFTDAYEAGAIPFAAYAGITLIRVVEYGSMAKALNLNTITLRIASYSMCLSIPLSVALAWKFGIWGISVCLLLSTAFVAGMYLWSYARLLNRPLHDFFPLWKLLLILAVAFFAAWLADFALASNLKVHMATQLRELAPSLAILASTTALVYGLLIVVIRSFCPQFFRTTT